MTQVIYVESASKAQDLQLKKPVCLTIGNFDGVHIGHANLINHTINCANNSNNYSAVVLFNVHPKVWFKKAENIEIFTLPEKIEAISKFNVDYIFVLDFANFCQLTGQQFIAQFLVQALNTTQMFIGQDFKMGCDLLCSNNLQNQLKTFNIILQVVEYIKLQNNVRVSSSNIRKYLSNGDITNANLALGKNFAVTLPVIKGNQLGRTIGFNTANLSMANNTLLKKGVYATKTLVNNNWYFSITNFGNRPTVNNSNNYLLENHIFNFNKDIYNQLITVQFYSYIREEVKFASLDDLKLQITKDVAEVKHFFNI